MKSNRLLLHSRLPRTPAATMIRMMSADGMSNVLANIASNQQEAQAADGKQMTYRMARNQHEVGQAAQCCPPRHLGPAVAAAAPIGPCLIVPPSHLWPIARETSSHRQTCHSSEA